MSKIMWLDAFSDSNAVGWKQDHGIAQLLDGRRPPLQQRFPVHLCHHPGQVVGTGPDPMVNGQFEQFDFIAN